MYYNLLVDVDIYVDKHLLYKFQILGISFNKRWCNKSHKVTFLDNIIKSDWYCKNSIDQIERRL